MKLLNRCLLTVCTIGLLSACASTPELRPRLTAGFLSDYSQLQPFETVSDAEVWRWVSADLKQGKYSSLKIEPLVFFPKPTTGDQVSIDALEELRTSLEATARKSAMKHKLPLVEKAQQDTLILKTALTSVELSYKKLSIKELIPIRLVFSGAELAMGKRDKELAVMLEYELLDGGTGKAVMRGVRKDAGLPVVNSKARMNIENAKPVLQDLVLDLDREFQKLEKQIF